MGLGCAAALPWRSWEHIGKKQNHNQKKNPKNPNKPRKKIHLENQSTKEHVIKCIDCICQMPKHACKMFSGTHLLKGFSLIRCLSQVHGARKRVFRMLKFTLGGQWHQGWWFKFSFHLLYDSKVGWRLFPKLTPASSHRHDQKTPRLSKGLEKRKSGALFLPLPLIPSLTFSKSLHLSVKLGQQHIVLWSAYVHF